MLFIRWAMCWKFCCSNLHFCTSQWCKLVWCTKVPKSTVFSQLSNCYSSVLPVVGCRVTVYLSQGSALSQVNYDPQNSLSGGEKRLQSSSRSLDTVSSSPRSHERTILGWDNIILQETRGRNVCLTVQSGDSAEPRKEWREKERETEPITLEERRTDLLQWGRSEGEICSSKEKDSIQRSPEEELQHRWWRQGCSRLKASFCWWKTERFLL